MNPNSDLPSYEEIFGSLDFKKGDDARSVLSPAAYLADLLQLLDDNLPTNGSSQVKGLHQRRADIKELFLNSENTYTSIPYLNVVNNILERKIGDNAYTVLKEKTYPFNLPFNFENERIKKFLHYLNISLEELYKLFSHEFDLVLVGREYLGLSIEEYNSIVQSPSQGELKAYFGITKSSGPLKVADFLKATQLSEAELRELLYQDLSDTAKERFNTKATNTNTERSKASDFFVNYGLGSYAALDAEEETIVWNTSKKTTLSIPDAWFDRVQRLIRLRQKTGLSFKELDLILRICCQHEYDLKLISALTEIPLPESGKRLVVIAQDKQNILHLRIFDHQGNKAIDLQEATLTKEQNKALEKLKPLLQPYWVSERNSIASTIPLETKKNIIDTVLSITGHSRQSDLDGQVIQRIAVIKQLCDRYDIAIDVACSFFSPVNVLGIGNDSEPQDLFNRVFNVKFAQFDKKYISSSYFVPQQYAEYTSLTCLDDILALNNKEYRVRVHQALSMSDVQLTTIVTKFREHAKLAGTGPSLLDSQAEIGLSALSLLFRLSQLVEMLDLSYEDFFNLFDILGKDPAIRLSSHFNTLIPTAPQEQDCYKIIAGNDVQASMWLVQMLCAISQWMQTYDLTSGELKEWLTGAYDEASAKVTQQQKIDFLNNLYQQFKPAMFDAFIFETEALDSRTARIVHQTFSETSSGLVSSSDRRLVHYDPLLTEKAAYQALTRLQRIYPADFTGLGLESKMLDKIFNNLILKGYISTEGILLEERFPQSAELFQLETDFSTHRDDLFMIIHDLLVDGMEIDSDEMGDDQDDEELDEEEMLDDEMDEGIDIDDEMIDDDGMDEEETSKPRPSAVELVELSIYPSDLEVITDLLEKERDELYDNLIFNGYIDEEGTVLKPQFFIADDNVDNFETNSGLTAYSRQIFNLILSHIHPFNQAELKLDKEVFSDLPLKAFEIDNLIENLKFNDYINADQLLLDKNALLATTPETFNLAIAFYPLRRQILKAIQAVIREFKLSFYTLNKDLFAETADDIVSHQVYQQLEPNYFQPDKLRSDSLHLTNVHEGLLTEEAENFFLDSDNVELFALGSYFTANDAAVIFNVIQTIIKTAKKYQFNPQVLEELDFDWEEQDELIDILESTGHLLTRTELPWEKVSYFLTIDNALEFTITGFEDYNKDIFFALHAIAKIIDTDVQEIATQFQALAEAQSVVLFEVLQDHFGIDMDILQILCQQVLQHPASIVEEFLVPTLAVVDRHDVITVEPDNNKFNFAYRRIRQFAAIAAKLGLNQIETAIIWQDQDLAEKFPEKLALPPGVDRIDALLDDGNGVIYLFIGNQYWRYSAKNYNLLPPDGKPLATPTAQPLTTLSELLDGVAKVEAAFREPNGSLVLIVQGIPYRKAKGSDRWVRQPKVWGKVLNNFQDPQRVDATFQDKEGRTYLFSGDQYIRYSGDDYAYVDEGYPLTIGNHWKQDALTVELPNAFQQSIDASFQDINGKTYLFKNNYYICLEASETEKQINQTWGKVRNNFESLEKIDAAYTDGHEVFLFSDDQVVVYQDSLEHAQVTVKEGFPKRLRNQYPNLPAEFVDGVEAAFKGTDGCVYLFKAGTVLQFSPDLSTSTEKPVKEIWGRVRNTILQSGQVDAAFVGLDGKTYLFSGDQYVRYTGADYAHVDEGFPRTIDQDWGGLDRVQAAFVFDGKTYLFGTGKGSDRTVYVRYSTNDYTAQDAGYPKPPNDNWWNLPVSLVAEGADFETIDTVFNAPDEKIYLFSGDKFIYFDQQQRWWSEPQQLDHHWSLPFKVKRVDAAFTGKDGKTYLFSGTEFTKYSSQDYSRADDRYPNITNRYWGHVTNNIAKTGRVDAALVVESHETIAGQPQTTVHTYLFSGNQYVRYQGNQYAEVEEGYPKSIATSLRQEPRFKNLGTTSDASLIASINTGIDAAFADQRQIYLFKGGHCHVISETLYKPYGDLGLESVSCAFIEDGTIFLSDKDGWQRHSSLEGQATHKTSILPPCLRTVPTSFQTGLQAVLQGRDRNTYLFKGSDCFNVSLNKQYPLGEEWGRVKNNIDIHNTVDAAFVGRDGKTYLFSGEQYVVYAADSLVNKTYVYGDIEQLPRSIKDHWGGLRRVALAFVKDEKTYLFEPADAQGNARYVCYSTTDYSQPDDGFPKVGDRDFWQIPMDYADENFQTIDAVLFERDNMFLLSGQHYIQFDSDIQQWTYPKPLSRIWRNIPFNNGSFSGIKTAFTGRDGRTYFFADENYVVYDNNQFTSPAPINARWGRLRNNFVNHPQGNRVDAAFIFQGQITYLFSGDQYVRYSGKDYRYVDEGYPKLIANNLRTEAGFQNLPEAFENALAPQIAAETGRIISAILADDRNLYLLIGNHWHVVSQSLTATYPLSRLGHLKNNLVQQNKVDAALFQTNNGKTYLFSGDQGVRYSDDTYAYVDDGYPKTLSDILTQELGITHLPNAFHYGIDAVLKGKDGKFYVFKDKEYQRSDQSAPTLISEYWGKIKNNFDETSDSALLNAAFISPNGKLYVFKDDQYIRYTNPEQTYVDEGFPKLIKDNWGNLPAGFEEAISGGFVFEGKTYLLKDNHYVRYSNVTYQLIDSIYPQPIKYRWGNWSDYLLNDLYIITRFKQLQDTPGTGDQTLLDFLNPETGTVADPYTMLAELFDWDIDEVKWLKRRNAFLTADTLFEMQFKLEIIIRLFDIFTLTKKMGTSPSELYKAVWLKRYSSNADEVNLKEAADTLYRFLALIHST
jgi:hypothetical protein